MATPATEALSPEAQQAQMVKNASREVRLGFVRKVYGILSFQLILTTVIATPIALQGKVFAAENQWLLSLSLVGYLACVCSMCCCNKATRTFPGNYILLLVLTATLSVVVGFTSAMYTPQSVLMCAGITAAIFLCMTVFAWTTKRDFTGFGPYLFAAVMCMMMFGFALSILSICGVPCEWGIMAYNFLGTLLFTFYIVYDTQLIIGELGGHKISFSVDDYAHAAIMLYIDIIQLFLHLLRMFGNRR
jgi:FtsH-binding integral membrane protein